MKRVVISIILLALTITIAVYSQFRTSACLKDFEASLTELYSACKNAGTENLDERRIAAVEEWEKADFLLEIYINNTDIEALEHQITVIRNCNAENKEQIERSCIIALAITKQILEFERITIKNIF